VLFSRKSKTESAIAAAAELRLEPEDGADLLPPGEMPPLHKSDAEFLRSRGIRVSPNRKIIPD
jgi:hypothetical protein